LGIRIIKCTVTATYTNTTGAAIATPAYTLPGFPGQLRTLADLYYNKYRDYDTSTGRYIQADPIGLKGGNSPYAYAMGNPVRYVDPSGQFVPLVVVGGAAGGAAVELSVQVGKNWWNGRDIFDPNCYDGGRILLSAALGAALGPFIKAPIGAGAGIYNRYKNLVGAPRNLNKELYKQADIATQSDFYGQALRGATIGIGKATYDEVTDND
jgi:RHS repeat-associated protein